MQSAGYYPMILCSQDLFTIHVLLCAKSMAPSCFHFLPSLLCTKLGFSLFAPALPRSSFWGGGCVLQLLSGPAGCRIAVPHHYMCNVCFTAESHLTRCRFLHRNVLPSAWQQSAFYIHIFPEQEFCVYWQWGRSFWEVLCFCRALSLWGTKEWAGQNS